ncbi:MAG: nickel pincer cofactor biosynthesis protein LarC [Actinomycetes bacterium]
MLAWFGCHAGASGDMFLGALVDAGAPLEDMQAAVDAIGVEPVRLSSRPVTRGGLGATKVDVHTSRTQVVRTWGNIRGLLEAAELAEPVRARALDVFARLAQAESAVHRVSPEQVRFHEVGALDAVADVLGSCAGLHALDVQAAVASPVALGNGMVRSEHGLLTVPGPAVLELLSAVGAPVYAGDVHHEMCTPTGAALLAATVTRWGGLPPMRVAATGSGAGRRDLSEVPNALRVVLGEPVVEEPAPTAELVVEANVDDLDPRLWPGILARLLDAGASDAWLTPIVMKKGRPAHTLSVLTGPDHADAVRRVVFTESSTIGVREHPVGKRALARQEHTVIVDGIRVRVKVSVLDGVAVNASPEFDDVAAAAARLGRPVKAVLAEAVAAALESATSEGKPPHR